MSLTPARRRAYSFGALTGAFSAVALLAGRDGRRRAAVVTGLLACCCGALAVGFEAAAGE